MVTQYSVSWFSKGRALISNYIIHQYIITLFTYRYLYYIYCYLFNDEKSVTFTRYRSWSCLVLFFHHSQHLSSSNSQIILLSIKQVSNLWPSDRQRDTPTESLPVSKTWLVKPRETRPSFSPWCTITLGRIAWHNFMLPSKHHLYSRITRKTSTMKYEI